MAVRTVSRRVSADCSSGINSSAPSARSSSSAAISLPVAMTRRAPRYLATCTACLPLTPVAPFTSTVSPGCRRARPSNAPQDAIPGLPRAAAVTSSIVSGNGSVRRRETTVRSAMEPKGARGLMKYTR